MKKLIAFLLTLLLCLALPFAVFADEKGGKLVDEAALLSEVEYESILAEFERVSAARNMDVCAVAVDGLDGKLIYDFADDYYDEQGFGIGPDASGILWLIDMDSCEYYFTTGGAAIGAFSDAEIEQLADAVLPYMETGDYYGAMEQYAALTDLFFETAAQNPEPVVGGAVNPPIPAPVVKKAPSAKSYVLGAVIALLVGFGISFIITAVMKGKMKSVRKQQGAYQYADESGLQLSEQTDRYLYHHVSVTPIPRNDNNNNNHHSGGSSVHRSSSGISHGGGGHRGF